MASVREPPPGFVAELQRRYGAEWSCRWNELVERWEIIGPSAAGRPVSQFFGYLYNPHTGAVNPPDQFGLLPFRDLDAEGQAALFQSMDETYLANPHDGPGTWKEKHRLASEHNANVGNGIRREMAEGYANMLAEYDLRRPWVKHHSKNPVERRIAWGGARR